MCLSFPDTKVKVVQSTYARAAYVIYMVLAVYTTIRLSINLSFIGINVIHVSVKVFNKRILRSNSSRGRSFKMLIVVILLQIIWLATSTIIDHILLKRTKITFDSIFKWLQILVMVNDGDLILAAEGRDDVIMFYPAIALGLALVGLFLLTLLIAAIINLKMRLTLRKPTHQHHVCSSSSGQSDENGQAILLNRME